MAPRTKLLTVPLGDDRFAVFRTAMSKSRRNFLSLLRAGRADYVVNDEALAMMRRLTMAAPLVARLARRRTRRFADEAAWLAHLEALGFDRLKITPDPVKVATEGALWGALCEQGLLEGTVIVSDGARQFGVGDHALCWAEQPKVPAMRSIVGMAAEGHAERLVYKLQPTNPADRRAVEIQRGLIWWFYADLKAYKRNPDPKRARMMRARFDRIFTRKTGYIMLDRQLAHLHRRKHELLRVLDRPEIPLHTNGSENDIRTVVTKRKISGGTVSEHGKIARDTMLGLMKTCAKLGVSYYRFLGDRFAVPDADIVPNLPSLIRLAAA